MKLKCFIASMGCNLLIACSSQNIQATNQTPTKYPASKSPTSEVISNEPKKPTSCEISAYQTASRCLYVKTNCPPGKLDCKDVDLTIVEKATGKTKKLKGEIWFNVVTGDFIGFNFPDPKDGLYSLTLRQSETFELWNKKETGTIFQEDIIKTPDPSTIEADRFW